MPTGKTSTSVIVGILILVAVLILSGVACLVWTVAQQRGLADLRKTNPVEYYVRHTPSAQNGEDVASALVGTWKLVGVKSQKTGKFVLLTTPDKYFKIFTLTNWTIVAYDANSNILYSASGPFTLQGDVFTESHETGTGKMAQFRGARPQFKIRLSNDTYYQAGIGLNSSSEEMWQRVE